MTRTILSHPWVERWSAEYYRWYPKALRLNSESRWTPQAAAVNGIYIHVPFCEVLCRFCPYNRFAVAPHDIDDFIDRIHAEASLYSRLGVHGQLEFVYLGGGTPSVLSANQLDKLLSGLRELFPFSDGAEISMEVHPFHASPERIREWRGVGANRFSCGVQSLNVDVLEQLGAHHSARQSRVAIDAVTGSGNGAIDLLYRCVGQSEDDVLADVETALFAGIQHISLYSLYLPDDSRQVSVRRTLGMADSARELMEQRGLFHYASCASGGYDYSLADHKGVYEERHWAAPQASYLGLGPGAFGYVDDTVVVNLHRLSSFSSALDSGRLPIGHYRSCDADELMHRYFTLGVKCIDVPFDAYQSQFLERPSDRFGMQFDLLTQEGLAVVDDAGLSLTEAGRHFVDQVSELFWSRPECLVEHPETDALRRSERELTPSGIIQLSDSRR